jgi:hypothetical protein
LKKPKPNSIILTFLLRKQFPLVLLGHTAGLFFKNAGRYS